MTRTIKINDVTLQEPNIPGWTIILFQEMFGVKGGRGRVGRTTELFCCQCSPQCQMNFLRSIFTHNKRCGINPVLLGAQLGAAGSLMIDQTVS